MKYVFPTCTLYHMRALKEILLYMWWKTVALGMYDSLHESLFQAGDLQILCPAVQMEQTQCTTFTVHKLCWSAAVFPDILLSWLSTAVV